MEESGTTSIIALRSPYSVQLPSGGGGGGVRTVPLIKPLSTSSTEYVRSMYGVLYYEVIRGLCEWGYAFVI
jgi:hypothetical protein